MIFLDLPTINGSGTTEQQLSEIRSYIYKNNEQINSALSNLTIDKIWEQTASAVSSANQSEDETPKILKQYQRIRDLIIKTADVVVQSDEKMEAVFNGSYLAKSQFGEYLEKTKLTIDETSVGITELYEYHTDLQSDLNNYKSDFQNYIKRGLLDNTGATPIYGIEVGLLNSSINVDGQSIPTGEKYRTRITPNKWSFLRGSSEVASITEDEITFPKANITGGSIDIGVDHKFYVDSEGNLTAKSGTFGGTLDASKITIRDSVTNAWNSKNNNRIVLETLNNNPSLSIYNSSERVFNLSEDGLDFYKRDGVDDVMVKFHRETDITGHWGVSVSLRRDYSAFFTLNSYEKNVPGSTRYELVYVPQHGHESSYPASPFNTAGVYIGTPLHVKGVTQGWTMTEADATIQIAAKQVWGPFNATDTDVYIDIINGVITDIRLTP